VVFLLCLAIVALYFVPMFSNVAAEGLFAISTLVAISAGTTALASLALYIFSPKKPHYILPLLVYLLFTATAGLLIFQTGGTGSPFIALWMLVSFFGGIFAVWGALPLLIASGTFVAISYLQGELTPGLAAVVGFSSIIPLVIGILIWRDHGENDEATKNVKNLASQLSEVANKSEIVINAIGDGVVAIDGQGVIQLINPAAQELLGWGKQDALMLNYKSVLQMTDQNNHEVDPANDPVRQVLNTNQQARSNKLTILTKSGKKINASMVVSPIGESGNGVITVFSDITKQKAEEREQAEFISTASHEMRTPVASIEGYLGLALNPNTATIDDKARDFIMKAHEAAQHLGRLFQDLLDVSKSEDGRMNNQPKVVDMSILTQTIVQGLVPKAQEKGLQLVFKPMEANGVKKIAPVYFVNQDNDHIREVLDNLIENGIKYTPKGEVEVDIDGTDDKVVVSIKDTGLGIPPEDIPHLFQKFYRVDNIDRQSIGGTGLGLFLCRRLAEAMGGRLWVESVYTKGSTFFFELPRINNQDAARLKEQQEQAAQQAAVQAPAPAPFVPDIAPAAQATPAQAPQGPAPTTQTAPKPATTVPRGESLTREQIAEHVRQLQAIARSQSSVPERPPARQIPVTSPEPPAEPPQA
jgi:PAS domain S-box-containing protein